MRDKVELVVMLVFAIEYVSDTTLVEEVCDGAWVETWEVTEELVVVA